jgi:hypothetical protein
MSECINTTCVPTTLEDYNNNYNFESGSSYTNDFAIPYGSGGSGGGWVIPPGGLVIPLPPDPIYPLVIYPPLNTVIVPTGGGRNPPRPTRTPVVIRQPLRPVGTPPARRRPSQGVGNDPQYINCDGEPVYLIHDLALWPRGIFFDDVNGELVVEANMFRSDTKTNANTRAHEYGLNVFNQLLGTGALSCEIPDDGTVNCDSVPFEGELTTASPVDHYNDPDTHYYTAYPVRIPPCTTMTVTINSVGFTPCVRMQSTAEYGEDTTNHGGRCGGSGTLAVTKDFLNYTTDEVNWYIIVTTRYPEQVGTYTVTVSCAPTCATPTEWITQYPSTEWVYDSPGYFAEQPVPLVMVVDDTAKTITVTCVATRNTVGLDYCSGVIGRLHHPMCFGGRKRFRLQVIDHGTTAYLDDTTITNGDVQAGIFWLGAPTPPTMHPSINLGGSADFVFDVEQCGEVSLYFAISSPTTTTGGTIPIMRDIYVNCTIILTEIPI